MRASQHARVLPREAQARVHCGSSVYERPGVYEDPIASLRSSLLNEAIGQGIEFGPNNFVIVGPPGIARYASQDSLFPG